MKKAISLLLALCFLFALLPAVGLNASAGGGSTYTLFSCDFEELSDLNGWTFSDLDGEANGWISTIDFMTEDELPQTGHYLVSASYVNDGAEGYFGGESGIQEPDNLATSPEIEIPADGYTALSFDIFAVDAGYPAEKITVYYSSGDYDYVLYSERLDDTASSDNSKTVAVDLSSYAGTKGNIVFRHHETTDQFMVGLDNVAVRCESEDESPVDIPIVGVLVSEPETGKEVSCTAQISSEYEGCYVANVSWSPDDTYFAANTSYTVTVTLETDPGYCFNEDSSFHINGKTATVLSCSANQAKISYTFSEELPDHLEVSYNYTEKTIAVGETVSLKAICEIPAAAESVEYQWYVADGPNLWGDPIYGETTDTYEFCGDVEGTVYFRCQISCMIDGIAIGTLSEEFKTVKINVTAGGPPAMFFEDVKPNHWFYHDVEFVYYSHLMYGTDATHFSPNLSTTRGMLVAILYRLEGSPAVSGTCPFSDVRAGSYYEDAITWAAENGVVSGMGNGKFAPDSKITREQLASIFYRFAQKKGWVCEEDYVMLAGFTDSNKVSSWATEAMSWAVGVGLVCGSNESTGLYLMPQGNALRCHVAAILHRFWKSYYNA